MMSGNIKSADKRILSVIFPWLGNSGKTGMSDFLNLAAKTSS